MVIVGWNNTTAKVSSITDSKGNAYQLAVGPTLLSGALSQSIYYAPKITAGGTNTVTVKFHRQQLIQTSGFWSIAGLVRPIRWMARRAVRKASR